MVPFSILYGNTTVKETVDNKFTGEFINKAVFEEIIDALDMDKEALNNFSEEVLDRFRNPFIKHMLSSIALNSISKFKVRVLPSLLEYVELNGEIPIRLTYALACLIRFYQGTWQGKKLPINDSVEIIEGFNKIWKLNDYNQIARAALGNVNYWGEDLTKIKMLPQAVSIALEEIDTNGIEDGFVNYKNRI